MESWKLRKRSFKGWKPTLNDSQEASDYHLHLQKLRHEYPPANAQYLANTAKQATISGGVTFQEPRRIRRPTQSIIVKQINPTKKRVTRCSRSKDTQQTYS